MFPTTLQADTGVGIGADFTYVLQGALRGELGLLMNALMQYECSAAVAGIQPLLFGPYRRGAGRLTLSGISIAALSERIAVSGRRLAVRVYFGAVMMSLREMDEPAASSVAM